jgi:hypothetical protein
MAELKTGLHKLKRVKKQSHAMSSFGIVNQ